MAEELHQSLDRLLKIEVYKIDSVLNFDDKLITEDIYRLKYRKLNLYQHNDLGLDIVIIDPDKYVLPRQEPYVNVTENLALKAVFNVIKRDEDGNVIYEDKIKNPVYSDLTYNEDAVGTLYLKGCIRVNTDVTNTPCDLKLELTVYDKITKNNVTLPQQIDMTVLPSMLEAPSDENSELIYILNHPIDHEFDVIANKKDEEYYFEDVISVRGVKKILEEVKKQYDATQTLLRSTLQNVTLTIGTGVGNDRFNCIGGEIEDISTPFGTEIKIKMPQTIKSVFLSTIVEDHGEEDDAQAFVETISPLPRLQFFIKKIENDTITLQCFNSERTSTGKIFNEVTQEFEDVIMETGVVNLDSLPANIYMTINILYMI